MVFAEQVAEAQRYAKGEMQVMEEKRKNRKRKRGGGDFDDGDQFVGVRDRISSGKDKKNKKKRKF